MVNALKVVKCGLANQIVLFASLNCIKVRHLKSKDVQCGCAKYKLILMPDSGFLSVEEGKKFSAGRLIIVLIILLFSIFLT